MEALDLLKLQAQGYAELYKDGKIDTKTFNILIDVIATAINKLK